MALDAGVLPGAIYEEVRASILSQQDAPGSALTESAIALRFGVSRPTAKIAIERLVAEGLLRREPHRAARVPELGRDEIADLFDNRALIEGAALARLATGGTIPGEALAAHRALQDSARTGAPFAEHDIAFHRALVAGQPSARLARMHDLLMGEIQLCISQVQAQDLVAPSEVAAQHQRILDAVIEGDSAAAELLTRQHIAGSRDRLLQHVHSPTAPKEK